MNTSRTTHTAVLLFALKVNSQKDAQIFGNVSFN